MGKDEGILIVVSGPSGTGKSSLCQAAMNKFKNIEFSVSYTTRPPRDGEVDGKDYYFVEKEIFDKMIEENAFIEWANVHGNKYGTSFGFIERKRSEGINILLDIDPQGALQIKSKNISAIFIFFVPPSKKALESRLRMRNTETEHDITKRLFNAKEEIKQCAWYDYIIINDIFERALEKFCSILLAEKCRKARSSITIQHLMSEFGIS